MIIFYTEHRFFLESVHRSKDDMLFALTTNVAIATEYGCVFKKGMLYYVKLLSPSFFHWHLPLSKKKIAPCNVCLTFFGLFSISSSVPAAIFLLHCKGVKTNGEECHITHYHGKIGQIPLRRFFQAQTLPKYVSDLFASFAQKKSNNNKLIVIGMLMSCCKLLFIRSLMISFFLYNQQYAYLLKNVINVWYLY